MEITHEQLLAAIAENGTEPDWRAEYANLYRMHQEALAAIQQQESPFVAELAELRVLTGGKVDLTVEYSSDARAPTSYKLYATGQHVGGFTEEHKTFEGAVIELLARVVEYRPETEPDADGARELLAAADEETP